MLKYYITGRQKRVGNSKRAETFLIANKNREAQNIIYSKLLYFLFDYSFCIFVYLILKTLMSQQ
jgi:hypothetical protein